MSINQEIKFLYTKKQKLNEQLYNLHLKCATTWQNYWHIIQSTIDSKLQQEIEMHYNNLNHKLDNLQKNQHGKNKAQHNSKGQHFYPRTVKLTKIKFTKEEMALLNHGLQHSIEKPLKTCWTNLKIETEQAIKLLDTKMQNPFRILATKKLKQIFTSNSHYNATQK